jgi:hypothetical protein
MGCRRKQNSPPVGEFDEKKLPSILIDSDFVLLLIVIDAGHSLAAEHVYKGLKAGEVGFLFPGIVDLRGGSSKALIKLPVTFPTLLISIVPQRGLKIFRAQASSCGVSKKSFPS